MKKVLFFFVIILSNQITSAQQYKEIDNMSKLGVCNTNLSKEIHSQDYTYGYKPKMNLIKINLTGLPIRNYSLQYERVLNKVISVGISYRNMPEGNLPFKKKILNSFEESDTEGRNIINNFTLSNYAITPEIRFYLGKKGYGRGFYIAPFFRNAGYEGNNFDIIYQDENNIDQTISLSGDIKSNTFGILFGSQWSLSKYIVLDWWILGPHIGSGKGNLSGVSSRPLSQSEQADIKQTLEDFDIPLVDKKVTVSSNGAIMDLDGIWGGLRAGISFGIKF